MSTEHSGVFPGIVLPPHVIHRALASLDQAVVAIDPHGEILYWNAAAERLYGYRAEEATGRPVSDLVASPAAAAAAAAWRTRLLPGRSCTSDWPVRDKAGRRFVASVMATAVVDDHGEPVALIGVSSDATWRRRDETRARVLAAIVAGSRDAIVEIDPHGVVLKANPAVEALYGYAPGELVGRNVAVLGAATRASTVAEELTSTGASDGVRLVKAQHPDGATFDLRLIVRPVHDGTGEVLGLTGTGRGLTAGTTVIEESDRRFRAGVDRCRLPQAVVSLDGTFETANHAWCELVGLRSDHLLGTGLPDLCHAGDPGDGEARLAALLGRERDEDAWEGVLRAAGGEEIPVRFHAALLHSTDGTPTGAVIFAHDRSDVQREVDHRRLHDDLTGLPNRTALESRLDRVVAHRQDHGHGSIAVLCADLDRFKLVNESQGHAAGDALLIEVAHRFAAAMRPEDTIGRFSSDTFAVVCAVSSDAEVGEIAERLQHALREPFDLDGQPVYLSTCVGVALCPPNAAPELLRCAETAMYWAKAVGAGTVRTFDRALADEGAARLALSNDLREALLRDTLTLDYQPIVDLNDGRIVGVEALTRWHHPTHGPISPISVVAVAEATGLAPALGRWTLNRACREAERLGALNPTPLRVAVNISPVHLADPGLEEAVLTAMRGSRLADGGLVLEITETSVTGDPTQARELLQRLRAFGVETAIDHFGAGYSSMAYLSRLSVSTLKIDRRFVRDITTDPDSLAITESIIKLAHIMRLTVAAEGVETLEQFKLLRRLGCDAGQGFLFSPGLAPDAFAEMVGGLAGERFFDTEPELAQAAVGASRSELVRRDSAAPR